MKKLKYFCLVFILLPICFLLVGCGKPTVTNIEKTGSNGNTDIYTIYYSNGTTSTLNVENGKDGADGADLDLKALYQLCVENNLYSGDFQSFLQNYINNNANENVGIYSAMNSVVSVYSAFKTIQYSKTAYEIGAGAGIIYKMDNVSNISYILTNAHVVGDYYSALSHKLPESIMVWQYGAEVDISATKHAMDSGYYADYKFKGGVSAKCVGLSIDYDLAILQVETDKLLNFNPDACAVKIADDYSIAENVYAIGNPEGVSVTSGVVSLVSEEISIPNFPIDSLTHVYRVIRIDVPIYGGNSGGGLFNSSGKLVGIINAGWKTSSEVADNYNYALPIDNAKQVANNLIYYAENGTPTYSLKHISMDELGASVNEKFVDFNETNGQLICDVYVSKLNDESLLNNCNLQLGDVFKSLTIDGTTYNITRYFQIDDLLISARKNSKITFHVLRGGNEQVVNLTNFENLI